MQRTVIILMLHFLLFACTSREEINISVKNAADFPQVEIQNTGNPPIVIRSPGEGIGSIGFALDSSITWLRGNPVVHATLGDQGQAYIWDTASAGKIVLEIRHNKPDLHVKLFAADSSIKATRWFLNIKAEEREYFTGLFERVVDGRQQDSWADSIRTAMDLRGQIVDMHLRPTVSAYAPFFLSGNNYGFFAEGTWPGRFDLGKTHPQAVQISFEGPSLTFKLYRAPSAVEIVKRHARDTGPSILPPQWAMGPWRWRDNHQHLQTYFDGTAVAAPYNSDLVEDVLMMAAYDIPMTAYWIDRPWGPGERGFDDYEFDPARFPQAQEMIRWLNGRDIELMMWIAPFVMGEMADVAEQRGYFLKSHVWRGARQVLMDFTNPEAVSWWGENGPGKLARMGIKGFKMDRADGEKLMDSLRLTTRIGTSYRENFNDYPRQYVKATYEAVRPVLGDDFILFPRAQYTGSAKYGGLWAGDTNGKPEGLRSAIIAMLRCSVMGYPLWGSDIGGYWGDFSRETCMRWLGFGCFSPLMEVGPTQDRGFWNNRAEPHYDTPLIATWRLYSRIRMKLIPYLMEQAREAQDSGMPIARPLFLNYPDQPEAWQDWQTYLLGPDILVSAIWQPGVEKHRLYLPAGEQWTDAWDREKTLQGGGYVEVEAPLHKIPIFIRQGSSLDLGDLNALYEESLGIAAKKPDLRELEQQEGWR